MAKSKASEWLEPDKLLLLEAWARDGLTEEQIANNIGIDRTTLYRWKEKERNIYNALKKGKEVVDIEVENALLKKCFGYNVPIKKTFKVKNVDYDSQTGKKIREYEELVTGYDETHVPADTTSQIFWLKNRKPSVWRDKVVTEDTTNNSGILKELVEALNNGKKN